VFVALALAAGAAGCGGDDEDTASTAAGGLSNADAKAMAQKSLLAIESYANAHGGSYAGADAEELAKLIPGLSPGDMEVVSTETSYTVSVVAESGTTFSLDGSKGVSPEHTCDPPGASGCSEDGDW
jgi:hypothetical protein